MFTEPFRGTLAVARGLVTPGQLRGPRFRRLFPDIYVRASAEVTLGLRSRAAHLFVAGRGVLGGFSAAEVLGASCGPADAPAEMVMLGGHRQRPHLGARGTGQLAEVVRLANPLAESPMQTRIRLALLFGGVPLPVLQDPVGPYALDMAYPALRIGIEYDGHEHLTQERAMRDLDRQAYLTAAGWRKVFRFPAATVLRSPESIPATVRGWLAAEAGRRGVSPAELMVSAA